MPCMQNEDSSCDELAGAKTIISSFVSTGIMRKRAMVVLLLVIDWQGRISSGDFGALCSIRSSAVEGQIAMAIFCRGGQILSRWSLRR